MGANNYIRVSCGAEDEIVTFDTHDRQSMQKALDRAGAILARYKSSFAAVSRSRLGRDGMVSAALYRPCPAVVLPVIGVSYAPRDVIDLPTARGRQGHHRR